nr:hypothetical protein [Enterococcus innesii]
MNITNSTELKEWISENLLTKREAIKITKQSAETFQQSVRTGMIRPFYESKEGKGPAIVRLYLKSEVETYAKQLDVRRKKERQNKV